MADQYSEQQIQDVAEAFARGEKITYTGPVDPPPPLEGEAMVMRGVRLPLSLDHRVKVAAQKAGIPFSALIREWIELGLTEMESDAVVPLSTLRRAIAHAAQAGRAA